MDSMENFRERFEALEKQMRAIGANVNTAENTTTPVTSAQIIREMIRHEDNLMVGRTNWMITLQGLLFAALAFSWEKGFPITLILNTLGLLFSIIFVRYLKLSDRAISRLLCWWERNRDNYNGPSVIGLKDKKIRALDRTLFPWKVVPYSFILTWVIFLIIKGIK
jgi:hypothetical protein